MYTYMYNLHIYIYIYTITNRNIKGPPGCNVIYHPVRNRRCIVLIYSPPRDNCIIPSMHITICHLRLQLKNGPKRKRLLLSRKKKS